MNPFKISNHSALKVKEWGRPGVYLFCLTNARGMSLAISNYGAVVVSCRVPDRLGRFDDVILGYDTLEEYTSDRYYMGAVVGRYANRIKGSLVNISGNDFPLSLSGNGFHHHGGIEGFNKKVYRPQVFESGNKRGVRLDYTSKDGEEGYPGNLHLTVVYTLEEDNTWTVEYESTTDKPTIINVTQHAYFNLGGHRNRSINGHQLTMAADKYLVVDEQYIPTGEMKPVEGTVFDFRNPLEIGTNIDSPQLAAGRGYDNTWVLESVKSDQLKAVATVTEPVSLRTLKVFTTEPSVHFYSGNFIEDNTIGKQGARYKSRSGFCLETQHFPDAPHHPHFPTTLLMPGEKFYSRTVFNFSASQ